MHELLACVVAAHLAAEKLFTPDYAYFSSTNSSLWADFECFVEVALESLALGLQSLLLQLISNDGNPQQYLQQPGILCLGIEPTHTTVEAARAKGNNTIERFFVVTSAG